MSKYSVITSRNGKFWTFSEGSKKWFTPYRDGQAVPPSRALWCRTQKEALENEGAAAIAHGV